jgi:hypothetical protein
LWKYTILLGAAISAVSISAFWLMVESKMENEKVATGSVWRFVWLVLAIGSLAVMAVGQFSAVFLPALVGQSPRMFSLFGSILLPGLLAMFIWSLRGKKRIRGFCLGALIGFILYMSAGVTAGYFQAEKRVIDKAVAASNDGLPKMLDEETRLDSVSIDQAEKRYTLHISLVNLSLLEIDPEVIDGVFEDYLKPGSCNNDVFKVFLEEGYKVNYMYKDRSGISVADYTVYPADCR